MSPGSASHPGITGRFGRMARARSTKYKYGIPGAHPGHHGRGRGPGCGYQYHGKAPGRPDLPPFAGYFTAYKSYKLHWAGEVWQHTRSPVLPPIVPPPETCAARLQGCPLPNRAS